MGREKLFAYYFFASILLRVTGDVPAAQSMSYDMGARDQEKDSTREALIQGIQRGSVTSGRLPSESRREGGP